MLQADVIIILEFLEDVLTLGAAVWRLGWRRAGVEGGNQVLECPGDQVTDVGVWPRVVVGERDKRWIQEKNSRSQNIYTK
jgi:hypothetical protein